jgi:hypothetical protein
MRAVVAREDRLASPRRRRKVDRQPPRHHHDDDESQGVDSSRLATTATKEGGQTVAASSRRVKMDDRMSGSRHSAATRVTRRLHRLRGATPRGVWLRARAFSLRRARAFSLRARAFS